MTLQKALDAPDCPQPYVFSQRDYLLLAEYGAFDALAKVELIDGAIIAVNAQYGRHIKTQSLLFRALAAACDALAGDLQAWVEGSVSIDDRTMPQPDIFVSRGLPDQGPVLLDDLAIIVEVADTTLRFDLDAKALVYATAGIPEYWVADVNGRVIHQMWSPAGQGYSQHREIGFGQPVNAITLDQLVVETAAL